MAKKTELRKEPLSPKIIMKKLLCTIFFAFPLHGFIEVTTPYHARTFPGEPRIDKQELCSADMRICGTTKSVCRYRPSSFHNLQYTQYAFFLGCNPIEHGFATAFIPFVHLKQSREANKPLECHATEPITLTVGATGSILSHPRLDFIDFSIESGITLPPSHDIGSASAGLPLKGVANVGIFDWLTVGLEADVILFFNPHPSSQKNICWYFKADHIMRGFSAHIGYSYSTQENTPLVWYPALPCWSMHTLHIAVSFDAAREQHPHLPWLEFFYDHVLSGKNISGYSLVGFRCGTYF
jgi:hypothetical protein